MSAELIAERLNKLEKQVKRLLEEHIAVKTELEATRKEAESLRLVVAKKEEEIKYFQNQHKIAKIATSVVDSTQDHTELKLKINEYIREIDKCISHLSE